MTPRCSNTDLAGIRPFACLIRRSAVAHITGPKLPNTANVVWNQVYLDVLFEYPIQSDTV